SNTAADDRRIHVVEPVFSQYASCDFHALLIQTTFCLGQVQGADISCVCAVRAIAEPTVQSRATAEIPTCDFIRPTKCVPADSCVHSVRRNLGGDDSGAGP